MISTTIEDQNANAGLAAGIVDEFELLDGNSPLPLSTTIMGLQTRKRMIRSTLLPPGKREKIPGPNHPRHKDG